jgi:hypothetical protein
MGNLQPYKPTVMQLILEAKSKTDIITALGNLSVADVVDAGYPALAYLRRPDVYGPEAVINVLALLIIEGTSVYEAAIPKEAARELAIEISACYYYLALEDVYVVLQQLKRSNLYGKLTPAKILHAVETHTEERARIAAEKSLNEHLSHKFSRTNYEKSSADAVRADELFQQFLDNYNSKAKSNPDPNSNRL